MKSLVTSFNEKVALITGAGSGMGRAVALGYAAHGGYSIVVDRYRNNAEKVVAEIMAAGGMAIAVEADLERKADVEGAIQTAIDRFGRLDFLMNNAFAHPAGFKPCLTEELSDEHWFSTSRLALDAVFFATRAALPVMRRQGGGSIINMSSISGLAGDRGGIAYNTMKAAIINFSRVIALEYAQFGVRCNSIAPGVIQTPLIAALDAFPDWKTDLFASVPLGRPGTPEEVANLILFMISDLGAFITGTTIVIDGGQTATTGVPSPLHLVAPSQA